MAVPELGPEQQSAGLDRALRSRQVRAELKQMLKAGEVTLREVLERDDDEVVARMRVVEVLEALPAVGKVKSERIMTQVGIAGSRRIRGLGHRQRAELLARFEA